jgi:hypothetical protein
MVESSKLLAQPDLSFFLQVGKALRLLQDQKVLPWRTVWFQWDNHSNLVKLATLMLYGALNEKDASFAV